MKVLFVGNSHTFFNDMPELLARFAEKTTGEKPSVTMLAYGGRGYRWHRKEYTALRFNLMYGGYDYVVLQQSAHPYPPVEETLEVGSDIIDLCRRCGVTPVVFMTWAEKRFPENQQKMIDTCEKLAKDTGAMLAPVGKVWEKVNLTYPDIELYFADGEHAGPYGDFLIAAVICKLLCGDISDSVSGYGFDFFGTLKGLDMQKPVLLEDPVMVETELDKDKTDIILKEIRNIMA